MDGLKRVTKKWKNIIVVDEEKKVLFEFDVGDTKKILQKNKRNKKISTKRKLKSLDGIKDLEIKKDDHQPKNKYGYLITSNSIIFSRNYTPPTVELQRNFDENARKEAQKNQQNEIRLDLNQITIPENEDEYDSYFNDGIENNDDFFYY